jgi:hypothetical protein
MNTPRINLPIVLMIVIALAMATSLATAASTACDDLDAYGDIIVESLPDNPGYVVAIAEWLDGADPADMSRSQLRTLSSALEAWAYGLADIPESQIPLSVRDLHDSFTRYIASYSVLIDTAMHGTYGETMIVAEVVEDAMIDLSDAFTAFGSCNSPTDTI